MSPEPSGSCLDCDLGISWQDRGKHEEAVWRDGGFGYDLIPQSHPHNLVSGDAINLDKLLPIVELRAAFAFDERLAGLDIRSTNDAASSTAIRLYVPGAYGDDLGLPPAVAPFDDEEHYAVVTSPVGGERDRSALARFYHVERIRGPHDGQFTCRYGNRVRLKSHSPHVNGGDTESLSRQACLAPAFANDPRGGARPLSRGIVQAEAHSRVLAPSVSVLAATEDRSHHERQWPIPQGSGDSPTAGFEAHLAHRRVRLDVVPGEIACPCKGRIRPLIDPLIHNSKVRRDALPREPQHLVAALWIGDDSSISSQRSGKDAIAMSRPDRTVSDDAGRVPIRWRRDAGRIAYIGAGS